MSGVEDDTGDAVPGATVTVTGPINAEPHSTTSQQDGRFTFDNLLPASYVLKIELDGFETYQKSFTLSPAELKSLRIRLQVARLQQDVTVEAETGDEPSTSDTNAATAKLSGDLKQKPEARQSRPHGRRVRCDQRTNVNNIVGVLSSPFFGRANSAAAARTLPFSVKYAFRRQ
jgi:hypothetical protein